MAKGQKRLNSARRSDHRATLADSIVLGGAQVQVDSTTPRQLPAWVKGLILCTLLFLAPLAVYSPVAHFSFVNYDDGDYVFANTHVNTGLTWANVRWAMTGFASGNWHPLAWLSHTLDCQLYGLNAGAHHITSLLLHAVNVVLLFLLLVKATRAYGKSFFVAILFALHPLNVESVAWVAERKNLLCTFFFMLALGAYGWYVRRPGVGRYLAVAVLFVFGLASKPMVITLPFVLLLLDYWPLRRIEGWTTPDRSFPVARAHLAHLALEKLPLLVLSLGSGVVTLFAQRSADAVQSLSTFPIGTRLANAVFAYSQYLWKAIQPRGLAPFYPSAPLTAVQVLAAILALLLVGVAVWRLRAGRPYLIIGFLWFLGTLVPVIGLVQVGVQSMADRYTYIPLIGVFVGVVWSVAESVKRGVNDRRLGAVAAVIVILMVVATVRQVSYWKNSTVLWTRALSVTVSNYVAEENLAVSLANSGRDEEALPHFETVREIRPDDATALLNIGMHRQKQGRYQEAIGAFERVIATAIDPADLPRVVAAYRGLGITYATLGDRAKARENFVHAIRLSPGETTELLNLSVLEAEDGADKLSQILSTHQTAEGYLQLGQLLRLGRRIPDALMAYEKALQLDPNLTEAKQALHELSGSSQ
jgi:protein O-mannosyl-transferase